MAFVGAGTNIYNLKAFRQLETNLVLQLDIKQNSH